MPIIKFSFTVGLDIQGENNSKLLINWHFPEWVLSNTSESLEDETSWSEKHKKKPHAFNHTPSLRFAGIMPVLRKFFLASLYISLLSYLTCSYIRPLYSVTLFLFFTNYGLVTLEIPLWRPGTVSWVCNLCGYIELLGRRASWLI